MRQEQVEVPSLTGKTSREKKFYDAASEKLAANLAHELGNPLDGVRRYISLALDQSMEESVTREYLLQAKKGISRMINILHDLLVYSRPCHHDLANVVDIHSLLEESLKEIEKDEEFSGISVQRIFCEESIYIEDRGLLIALHNLYKNAVQAMKGRGILTVATWQQNGSVGVAIEDTGEGVPDAIKEHIFEPFFSTKHQSEGTGIGLALSREIVERCGGELRYENVSDPMPGARFILILPRKRASSRR